MSLLQKALTNFGALLLSMLFGKPWGFQRLLTINWATPSGGSEIELGGNGTLIALVGPRKTAAKGSSEIAPRGSATLLAAALST